MSWGERGDGPGQLLSPRGLTVDSQADVYVADYFNDRVQVFDADGNYLRQWGAYGSGDGEFDRPADVALASNLVFVTDYGNDRVQVYTTQGAYLRSWGAAGSGNGQFNGPTGIAANGDVYVVESGNDRVQVFSNVGVYQFKWGANGNGSGQFDGPDRITITNNQVYVSDNHARVQIFDMNGNHQETLTSPDGYTWIVIADVAADQDGYIYVRSGGWIYVHRPVGVFTERYQIEDVDGNFVSGERISFGPNGELYAVSTTNIGLYLYDVELMP